MTITEPHSETHQSLGGAKTSSSRSPSPLLADNNDIDIDRLPTSTQETTSLIDNGAASDPTTSTPRRISTSSTTIRKVTLLAALLTILQFSLLTIFVAYVWSHRVVHRSGVIWVAISNNLLLLMSTIISRVPPIVVPFAMSIAAYGFAREWLASSPLPEGRANPTPEQYQIALQVNGRADLGAVWATVKYLYGRSGGPRHPDWLTRSIAALFVLIWLAYLIGGIDIWLHQAVYAGRLTSFSISSEPHTDFSRMVDPRFCSSPPNVVNDSCVLNPLNTTIPIADEGLATATNKSQIHEVIVLPNTTIALLLPAYAKRSQRAYEASTLATYTTCAPMSRECNLRLSPWAPQFTTRFLYGCVKQPAFSGSFDAASGMKTLESSEIYGFYDSGQHSPVYGDSLGAWTQPLQLGITASLPYNLSRNQADPQLVKGIEGGYGVLLWCEMTILNVTYHHNPYRNNSIAVLNHTLANPRDLFIISGPIYSGFGANIIYSSALSSTLIDFETWTRAYASQLSRVALSLAAGVIVPTKSLIDYPTNSPVPVSKVPFPPAITFIVANALFSACVLLICLGMNATHGPVLRDGKGGHVSAVRLAQMRLTSSAALVYQMFCTDAVGYRKSGCDDSDSLLALDKSEEVRICVGVLEKSDEEDDSGTCRFGMTTQGPTQPLYEVQGTTSV